MYKITYELNNSVTTFYRDERTDDCYKLVDPILSLKANSSGDLSFSVTENNPIYSIIQRMRGLVKVYKNNNLIWEGRVITEDTDFWKTKSVSCEGIMSCLNDTRQPQKAYKDLVMRSLVENLLSIHNQKVDDTKKFDIGIVTVNSEDVIGSFTTNYDSTWECFSKLLDTYGGYLQVRYADGHRYLDFIKEPLNTSFQKIEFGVNLTDFTRTYDMSSLCTVLLPLGETLASAGGKSVGNIVDSHLASGYYIQFTPVEGTGGHAEMRYDPGLGDSYRGSSTWFDVEAGKTYYISCRNHDGRTMWALWDSAGQLYDHYEAGTGFTDLVEYKLDIPPSDVGNVYRLAIAGFGYDIMPRVNAAIEAEEAFDTYVTVESANNGSVYVVNQEAVTNYGWIEKQLTWEKIKEPAELLKVAQTYLNDGQFDEMTLDVRAMDLQLLGVDAGSIDILNNVQVVSAPHGLNKIFPVTELTIHMSAPSNNEFVLGSKTEQTLSGLMSSQNDELFAKINALPSQSAILESARDNASQLINAANTGRFALEYDSEGNTTGWRLINTKDWTTEGATGWRFTYGGLGYFPKGLDNPVRTAITGPDGGIVASSITTGVMSADRMLGGTLRLGHWPKGDGTYDDGTMIVKDANDNSIATVGVLGHDDQGNNIYGAYITGTFHSQGPAGIGGTVHIQNGWISGSDPTKGSISPDSGLMGTQGLSIDYGTMAIVTNNLYTGPFPFSGALYRAETGSATVQGLNGYSVSLSFVNGFMTSMSIDYNPDNVVSKGDINSIWDEINSIKSFIDMP